MAGRKFLNPLVKVVLCVMGVASMAYLLYPDIMRGDFSDRLTIVRVLVFLGFSYLLAQSVKEILNRPND